MADVLVSKWRTWRKRNKIVLTFLFPSLFKYECSTTSGIQFILMGIIFNGFLTYYISRGTLIHGFQTLCAYTSDTLVLIDIYIHCSNDHQNTVKSFILMGIEFYGFLKNYILVGIWKHGFHIFVYRYICWIYVHWHLCSGFRWTMESMKISAQQTIMTSQS